MAALVTFGELLMRLATPGFNRFNQAAHLELSFGGAEANAAVMCAALGASAEFVSRLPQSPLAARALAELRGLGVKVENVRRGGERIGIYFLEAGASQRAPNVIYDRAHSAFAEIQPGETRWEEVFSAEPRTRWFHWTGITPAVSDSAAAALKEACAVARAQGITISADLNYRSKLWTLDKARSVITPLMEHVDVFFGGEDAREFFGLPEAHSGSRPEQCEELCAQLVDRLGFKRVTMTMRDSVSASHHGWSGMLYEGGRAFTSAKYDMTVVDRVGGGDSFAGAMIFALLRGDDPQKAIEFGIAASCLKHSIVGDYNRVSLDEVEALASGGNARIKR